MSRAQKVSLASLLACVGCKEPPTPQYAAVDLPEARPSQVAAPPAKPVEASSGVDDDVVANCGRGTGRRPDGTCERMRLRMLDHVQQAQVPGGRFVMGYPPTRYDAAPARQQPQILWPSQPPRYAQTGSFWIDLHEVSREQYAKCVAAEKCTPAECPGNEDPTTRFPADVAPTLPQTCVTHQQAEAFCAAAGQRLPTEVEWEFAARGPDARPYPWGGQVRDEYNAELAPVGGLAGDISFFGLRGMGTNAREWTASAFDPDFPLATFVQGFRRDDGPLRRARATARSGWVTKGGQTGSRSEKADPDLRLGFRCAGDVDPNELALVVPDEAPPVPLVYDASAELQLFGGVAEAVDRAEAEAFCDGVVVSWRGETLDDWALPTLEEIQAIADAFRGPGPFWTQGAAGVQRGVGQHPMGTDPWVVDEAAAEEALAARCVRKTGTGG